MDMKTIKTFSIYAAVILLVFSSCANPLGDGDSAKGTDGRSDLRLFFNFPSGRTIAPSEEDLDISGYTIMLSRRGYSDLSATVESATGEQGFLMEDVAVGNWTVSVDALGGDGTAIASGSTIVAVAAGQNDVNIVLSYKRTSGRGGLELTYILPTYLISSFDDSSEEERIVASIRSDVLYSSQGQFPQSPVGTTAPSAVQAGLVYPDGSGAALTATLLPEGTKGMSRIIVSGTGLKAGSPVLKLGPLVNGTFQPAIMEAVWIFGNVVTSASKTILPNKPMYVDLYDSENEYELEWSEILSAYGYRVYANEFDGANLVGDPIQIMDMSADDLLNSGYYYPDLYGGMYFLPDDFMRFYFNSKLDPFKDYLLTVSAHCGAYESEFDFDLEGTVYEPRGWADLYVPETSVTINFWEVSGATEYQIYIDNGNDDDPLSLVPLDSTAILSLGYEPYNGKKRYFYDFTTVLTGLANKDDYYGDPEVFISFTVGGVESDLLSAGIFNFSSGW